jgi:hypothetical protein
MMKETTMTKIQKGTQVLEIHPWNRGERGETYTVSVRRLTIESLGKKQGTATVVEGGAFTKRQISPEQIGTSIFAEADMTEATILAAAKKYQDDEIAYYESKIGNDSFCQSSILKGLANVRKPLLVKSYEELSAIVSAEVRARK